MSKSPSDGAAPPKSFAVILGQCEDGLLLPDLSEKLQALSRALAVHAESFGKASGSLTLTMRLLVEANGTTRIDTAVAVKEPAPARPASMFWQDPKSANLLNENPKQQRLPLHEVKPRQEAQDLGPTERDADNV